MAIEDVKKDQLKIVTIISLITMGLTPKGAILIMAKLVLG